jgi:ketosteroid isomerase-like protein
MKQIGLGRIWLGLLFVLLAGCASRPKVALDAETAIRSVLAAQQAAWNRQDLAGFMAGYARGDQTRFASGGDVTRGWQTVFDRYARRYGTAEAMGRLNFSALEITVLGEDSAVAFGRWELERSADRPGGLFTLVFRRLPEGWRVVHDHTSSGSP